jgi:hypothetical protein
MHSYEVEVSYLKCKLPVIDKLVMLPDVRRVSVEKIGYGKDLFRLRVLTRYPTKDEMAAAFDRAVLQKPKVEAVRTLIDGKHDIGVEEV